jgi:hypothetical protein
MVGDGGEATGLDNAAGGSAEVRAWTTTGAINPKTRARPPIGKRDLCIAVPLRWSSRWGGAVLEANMWEI